MNSNFGKKEEKKKKREENPTKANVPIAQNTQFYYLTCSITFEIIEHNIYKESLLVLIVKGSY